MNNQAATKNREDEVFSSWQEDQSDQKLVNTTNKVFISGKIVQPLEYDHSDSWEKFYSTRVIVTRISGIKDFVPVMISEFLLEKDMNQESFQGKFVEIAGQFRSYNKHDEYGRAHLQLFLFATAISIYDDESEMEEVSNANVIYLDGYICKEPAYRTTPLGREITDLLIAVNRKYRKSDYIPCIAWGKIAKYAGGLNVGCRVRIYGRIQSREYFKRYSPDSDAGEYRVAYEVSVRRFQFIEDSVTIEI